MLDVPPPKRFDRPARPLTQRARKVLFAAVTEYIATGNPVGSRTLSRNYGIDLSAATIRNVLADLEDDGYVHQPHTSAGRVPTERALRCFINTLSDFQAIPRPQQEQLQQRMAEIYDVAGSHSADALRGTGKLLSELSGAAAIVAEAPAKTRVLAQLRFIRTKPEQLLAVLVFDDGIVENRYIAVDKGLDAEQLVRIHNLLADVVDGRSLADARELFARRLADERGRLDALRQQAFALGQKAVSDMPRQQTGVVIEGSSRLMDLPEYEDVDRLKQLVRALEEREDLLCLLDRTIDAGVVTVYIGSETGELRAAQLSLVVAPYGDVSHGGTVGVLGPTRMDYSRMVPLVDATAAALTEVLKKTP